MHTVFEPSSQQILSFDTKNEVAPLKQESISELEFQAADVCASPCELFIEEARLTLSQ